MALLLNTGFLLIENHFLLELMKLILSKSLKHVHRTCPQHVHIDY